MAFCRVRKEGMGGARGGANGANRSSLRAQNESRAFTASLRFGEKRRWSKCNANQMFLRKTYERRKKWVLGAGIARRKLDSRSIGPRKRSPDPNGLRGVELRGGENAAPGKEGAGKRGFGGKREMEPS